MNIYSLACVPNPLLLWGAHFIRHGQARLTGYEASLIYALMATQSHQMMPMSDVHIV